MTRPPHNQRHVHANHQHDSHDDHSHKHGQHKHHHGHHHHHGMHAHGSATANIGFAFFLNLAFAIFELVGGYLTGSMAVMADAVHDFGDSMTLGVAFVLQKSSDRRRTKQFTYGFGRLSLLSALLAGFVLVVGAVMILVAALPRLWQPVAPPNGWGMMVLALVGVAVNGIAALRLRKGSTENEQMLSWHMIEDLLGWIAVLIGAVLIIMTGWAWLDPLLACLVSAFILFNVVRRFWQTLLLFLQRSPIEFDEERFISGVRSLEGVESVHDVHAWSIDGEQNILSVHVVVATSATSPAAIMRIKREVREQAKTFGQFHATVEIEWNEERCADTC